MKMRTIALLAVLCLLPPTRAFTGGNVILPGVVEEFLAEKEMLLLDESLDLTTLRPIPAGKLVWLDYKKNRIFVVWILVTVEGDAYTYGEVDGNSILKVIWALREGSEEPNVFTWLNIGRILELMRAVPRLPTA